MTLWLKSGHISLRVRRTKNKCLIHTWVALGARCILYNISQTVLRSSSQFCINIYCTCVGLFSVLSILHVKVGCVFFSSPPGGLSHISQPALRISSQFCMAIYCTCAGQFSVPFCFYITFKGCVFFLLSRCNSVWPEKRHLLSIYINLQCCVFSHCSFYVLIDIIKPRNVCPPLLKDSQPVLIMFLSSILVLASLWRRFIHCTFYAVLSFLSSLLRILSLIWEFLSFLYLYAHSHSPSLHGTTLIFLTSALIIT